jgi:hypothetical protein
VYIYVLILSDQSFFIVPFSLGKYPGYPTNHQAKGICRAVLNHTTALLGLLGQCSDSMAESVEVHVVCVAGADPVPFSFESMVGIASAKCDAELFGPEATVAVACRIPYADILRHANQLSQSSLANGFFEGKKNGKVSTSYAAMPVALAGSIGLCPSGPSIKHARTHFEEVKGNGSRVCSAFPSAVAWEGLATAFPEVIQGARCA